MRLREINIEAGLLILGRDLLRECAAFDGTSRVPRQALHLATPSKFRRTTRSFFPDGTAPDPRGAGSQRGITPVRASRTSATENQAFAN